MLLDLRETVRNSKPIKYTLITIICIPFALVGIGSYLGGGAYQDVAEVDGVAITSNQVESAYNGLVRQYRQMFGGQIPQNLLPDDAIRQQALDGLVTDIVVRNTIADQKFAVGDETLGRAIRSNPEFQTEGVFDKEKYEQLLRGSRLNVASYEESLRSSAALTQFRAGVESTSFQLPSESKRLESLSNQTRTIDYVRYSIDSALENIEVTDEEISAYFDENAENYKFPQRAKIQYIELKKSDIAAEIEVSEEDVEAHYKNNPNSFITKRELRETSHILLEVDVNDSDKVAEKTKQLKELKERIDAGEDFAALAGEFSEDIGSSLSGGSLGLFEAGVFGTPFDNAVMTLTESGQVSDVVSTPAGVHLIKLDKLEPAVTTPFEEAKDDIVSLLQNNAADIEYLELQTAMEENIASDPETLDVAADAANVEVQSTDWIDVDTQDNPLFANPQVMAAAFSDDVVDNGNNSDLIEIGPGHVLSLRILEHEGPRPKALEDVSEEITLQLKRDGAATVLDESAKQAVSLMLKGTPVSKVAKDDPNAQATSNEVLNRQSVVLDQSAVSEIFALAKPAEGKVLVKSVTMQNGDKVAYALKAVNTPEPAEDEEADTAQIVNAGLGQAELAAIIANLREKADVSIEE